MPDETTQWESIYENYLEYIDRYVDEGTIGAGGKLPLQSAALEGGGNSMIIGNESSLEPELLLESKFGCNNNPNVASLTDYTLSHLPIGLTEILKVQITEDHKSYWQLTADIIDAADSSTFSIGYEMLNRFESLVSLVLCTPVGTGGSERWSDKWLQNEILWDSSILASYAGFPILEGILKSICSDYVNMDGTVKEGEAIRTFCGIEEERCSNVGHLLHHIEQVVADEDLAARLEMMRGRVADFYNPSWSDSYNWSKEKALGNSGLAGLRNSWLHGEEEADAANGILLNYICLFIWDEIYEGGWWPDQT